MRKSHPPDPEVVAATEEFAAEVEDYPTLARAYYRRPRVSREDTPPVASPLPVPDPAPRALWWPGAIVLVFAIIGFLATLDTVAHIL